MASPSSPTPSERAAARHLLKALTRGDADALRRVRLQFADVRDLPDGQVAAAMGLMRCQQVIVRERASVTPAEGPTGLSPSTQIARDRFLRHMKLTPFWHTDRSGCTVSYDPWSGPAHAVVIGSAGSGKTGFLNDLVADLLRGEETSVITLSGSDGFDALLCLSQSGQRLEARAIDPCIGSVPQMSAFLPVFVDLIRRGDGRPPLSAEERSLLITAIQDAAVSGQPLTLGRLLEYLDPTSAPARTLASYRQLDPRPIQPGDLAAALTALTIRSTPGWMGLEIAACLLQALTVALAERLTRKRAALIIDDAWVFLHDPIVSGLVADLVRRCRAPGLVVVCCTTTVSDFLKNSAGQAILSSAGRRFLFKQPITPDTEALGLSTDQVNALRSLQVEPWQFVEALVLGEGQEQIMRVVHTAHFRWAVTQVATEVTERREREQQYRILGLSPRSALEGAIEDCVRAHAIPGSSPKPRSGPMPSDEY
jgi:hypothetical protein